MLSLPPYYEDNYNAVRCISPNIMTDIYGSVSKYALPSLPKSIGCASNVVGYGNNIKNNISREPTMVNDEYTTLCIGDMPEDDMDMCYRKLQGTEPIFIPITHFSYNEDQHNTHYCDMLGMGRVPKERYSWYGEIQALCNNPSHDDLQRINVMVQNNDRIPVSLINKDGSRRIGMKGYVYGISYDINISHDLAEQWKIRVGLRDII